jgi:outer membrane protein TolC
MTAFSLRKIHWLLLFSLFVIYLVAVKAQDDEGPSGSMMDSPIQSTPDDVQQDETDEADENTVAEPSITPEPTPAAIEENLNIPSPRDSVKKPAPKKVVKKEKDPLRSEEPALIDPENQRFQKTEGKAVTLADIVQEGLQMNGEEKVRDFSRRSLDIEDKDNHQGFWYPRLELFLETDNMRLLRAYKGNKGPTPNTDTPTGRAGIGFREYTLFNWGKDHLNFMVRRNTINRERIVLSEEKRNLKLDLIEAYFELARRQMDEEIYKDQSKNAQFFYRMARERAGIGKITRAEYYQARNEYLRAQSEYQASKFDIISANERLVNLMGVSSETVYRPVDRLQFTKVKLPLTDAVTLADTDNSSVLDWRTALENAQKNQEKARKDNLPLPKISVNLGAYTYAFSKNVNTLGYETYPGSDDIEVAASINATWAIWGTDGFLNQRKLEKAAIAKEVAGLQLTNAKRTAQTDARKRHAGILNIENQIEVAKARIETATKALDTLKDGYLSQRVRMYELADALRAWKDAATNYEKLKYDHLREKVEMARTMGRDDLVTEHFDDVAVREGMP